MQESPDDIKKHLQELEGWGLKDGMILKSYGLESFMEAVEFVNDLARIAEERNHHPVITIASKTVSISSVSFDVGHLTDRDFGLAKAVDEIFSKKYRKKASRGDDFMEDEDRLLMQEEEKDRARLRTRGPYRKSSGAGL